jgi:hypothetical protein
MLRYTNRDFPSYAFVPGRNPHPKSNPEGHLYGKPEEKYKTIENYLNSEHYLYGIDLFNHGYYWEAHEVLEGLWNAHNREGDIADFLKALIRLSAAGVKVKQGQERGIRDHSLAAQNTFKNIAKKIDQDLFLGVSLNTLIENVDKIQINIDNGYFLSKKEDNIVLEFIIVYL